MAHSELLTRDAARESGSRWLRYAANAVLSIGGTLTLVGFVYYCFRYAPSIEERFLTPSDAALRYVALAVLPLALFLSLRLRPRARIGVAAFCVSFVILLYAADIVLHVSRLGGGGTPFWNIDRGSSETKNEVARLARAASVKVDTRDRIEVLDQLRQAGTDAVPAVMLADILLNGDGLVQPSESSSADELLPLGGISRTFTVLCNEETSQYVTYQSDEHGFRNPAGVWNSTHADVAAVGQSLTQGYCAPEGKGFVDLLRARYPATLNLGVSGESSLLQLAAIKEYLPRYKPGAVLWFFTEAIDLHDLYDESTHPLVMRYLEPTFTQRLLTRQPAIDSALRRFVSDQEAKMRRRRPQGGGPSLVERSLGIAKLWDLREKLARSYGIESDDTQAWFLLKQLAQDLLSDALSQAKVVTRSWGGTLYFVYLPSWNRYANGARIPERDRMRVVNLVNTLGIPVIDVQPAFSAHPDPLSLFPFRRFGHYNDAGNKLVADTVLKFLAANARSEPPPTPPPAASRGELQPSRP